jgi:hypothetical protein
MAGILVLDLLEVVAVLSPLISAVKLISRGVISLDSVLTAELIIGQFDGWDGRFRGR